MSSAACHDACMEREARCTIRNMCELSKEEGRTTTAVRLQEALASMSGRTMTEGRSERAGAPFFLHISRHAFARTRVLRWLLYMAGASTFRR
jgi:hypothetical protein